MKGIYEFYWNAGRSGSLEGIFIADVSSVAGIIGKEVYFGEVLGKHSEVYGVINDGDIVLKSDDQDFIAKFEGILGEGYSSGFNPLDYHEPSDEDEESDED